MEEEDQHDENIEEENSEYSVTNYFDGNHCPLIEWMDCFKNKNYFRKNFFVS